MSKQQPTSIETQAHEEAKVPPPPGFMSRARINSIEQYEALYRESIEAPETFWRRETSDLTLRAPWTETLAWEPPFARWFSDAKLNVSESCLDRHLGSPREDKRAIVWEGEDGSTRNVTYKELHAQVVQLAAALRELGIEAGDRIVIYMGMVPEAVVAMLACARIGAPHSVVFGGFAADALQKRIQDCGARLVITQDAAPRRGRPVLLKATVNEALASGTPVEHVVVLDRMGLAAEHHVAGRDLDYAELVAKADPARGAAEVVDAEHPLFILYTSGSTGKPKGILHTSLGYLVGAHVSTKYVFDLQEDDVYWCTADIGWITGHSYLVYGPLSNGATCVVYEGAPNHPDWGRFWSIVERHGVTILYTAPTAIRAFMRAGDKWVTEHDLSSLRLLGSVGEPINPEAWQWYHRVVGGGRCPIVDTWWQTETGSILITTLPGAHPAKPGSAGLPFFGVEAQVVSDSGEPVPPDRGGLLVLDRPWPSMLRNVYGDPERYRTQYFSMSTNRYFCGDGAHRTSDGYIQVIGRIDDVLNVSGHRIGTAEVESALVGHEGVAEAAAVGRPDELKGQALVVFVTTKAPPDDASRLAADLRAHVAREIGKFAAPDEIRFAEALPKTRSGKIMRRLLKDIAADRTPQGDVSTLEDASVLDRLLEAGKGH